MEAKRKLDVFLSPESIAVVGASERPGSWGSFIMEGLRRGGYSRPIYPVNPRAASLYGLKTWAQMQDIPRPVDLAVLAVPEQLAEQIIRACGEKKVRGIIMITAGFGEAQADGRAREEAMGALARSYGMRILGPNVSGVFNLDAHFNASPAGEVFGSRLAAVCQGGYAFYDLLDSGRPRRMGVGRFVHSGNECDLSVTDFLELYGSDPDIEGIVLYLETIRDGGRFRDAARRAARSKPIVVYKAGRTRGGIRAAGSHTGALAGRRDLYEGLFAQLNIISSPTMELLLPVAHAAVERPPMGGRRVAIITMGGSWGVILSDSLEEKGLTVPQLGGALQQRLRDLGMPVRASTRNPVDIGAAGVGSIGPEKLTEMGRLILASGEVDALVLHGLGQPGKPDEAAPQQWQFFLDLEKQMMKGIGALEQEIGRPVMIGCHFSPWESRTVHELNREGLRIYDAIEDIAHILALMYRYHKNRS